MNLSIIFLAIYCSLSVSAFTDVCYGDLGCFSDRPPYGGTQLRQKGFPPQSPEKVGTSFQIHTRNSSAKITYNNDTLSSIYNPSVPTRFIIHGFIQNKEKPWINEMKDTLLKAEDLNVIVVDWELGAKFPYAQASSNTRIVGAQIAKLIEGLVDRTGADLNGFHLIGHSLGAHVAGYAGERLKKLGRITGLDPAGPLFEFSDDKVRLDKSDAQFVDIIHTDGASILQLGLGLQQLSGHVDFFPNGGRFQPSCPPTSVKLLSGIFNFATSNFDALDNYSGCSHVAAIKFFIDSIKNRKCYTAYPCESKEEFDKGNCIKCTDKGCNQMGYWASGSKSLDKQYLNTQSANEEPFCTHNYQITLNSANLRSSNQALGTFKIRLSSSSSYAQTIDDSDTIFKSKTVSVHMATFNENVESSIDRVFVSYVRTNNIFTWWIYDKEWSFSSVEVFVGEDQTKLKFCPIADGMVGQKGVEFKRC